MYVVLQNRDGLRVIMCGTEETDELICKFLDVYWFAVCLCVCFLFLLIIFHFAVNDALVVIWKLLTDQLDTNKLTEKSLLDFANNSKFTLALDECVGIGDGIIEHTDTDLINKLAKLKN